MDLSLATTGFSSISQVSGPLPPQAPSAAVVPNTTATTSQVAMNSLMPTAFSQIQVMSIFVARKLIQPARYTGPDREEKRRSDIMRLVKVVKSEAAGQQTQHR